jgi:hypothetical protein
VHICVNQSMGDEKSKAKKRKRTDASSTELIFKK